AAGLAGRSRCARTARLRQRRKRPAARPDRLRARDGNRSRSFEPPQCRDARRFRSVTERSMLAPVLELVPRGHGGELEQGAPAARVAVAEVGAVVVPGHLEQALLDAMVEPGAAEDELAQPVD